MILVQGMVITFITQAKCYLVSTDPTCNAASIQNEQLRMDIEYDVHEQFKSGIHSCKPYAALACVKLKSQTIVHSHVISKDT